jgi:hypothetical protein
MFRLPAGARALLIIGLAVPTVHGCSDSKEDPPKVCAEHVSTIDLTTPEVSLKNDVMPIVTRSCTFTTCHGGGSGNLKLSTGAGATRDALVNVNAPELPRMKLVAPGDPKNSWLMKKLDGDHCLLDAECTDKSCGSTMPQGGDQLDVAERDKFRRWIAQGAKDN